MIIISTLFLYRSRMGIRADTSDSDTCISVSFNLFQSYKKSHISMMTRPPTATHTVLLNFLNYNTAN